MPSRKRRLTLAPGANGVPRVMVPAESELLNPPPFGCAGDTSSVVPCTVIVHGVAKGVHVTGSLMPLTTTSGEVLARKSAKPDGAEKVVKSTTRKRRRVIGEP